MAAFVLRRMTRHLVLAVLAMSLTYLLAAVALDPRAGYEGRAPRPPEAVVDARLTALNLNDRTPLAERYLIWAGGVLHGDLGRTWDGEPVGAELRRRLGVSARLVLPGAVLGCGLGVLLGTWAAARHGRAADRIITFGSCLLPAVPLFVLATLLQILAVKANDAMGVRAFVWVGETASDAPDGTAGVADRLRHLLLPTAAVALAQLGVCCRYQRALMLDVLDAGFVRAARARGLRRRSALLRHGLRAQLVPMTTYLAYASGLLILGGLFTEKVFGRHGVGEWLAVSVARGDVNAVAGVGCAAVGAVLLAGFASDVLNGVLDPRVRSAS
ncbi:MAG TPA: ABC transporter permease [Spirillospora sp.]